MAFNTKNIITDAGTLPVPQYFNPASDAYEVALGTGGAINVNVTGTVTVGTHAVTISGTPAVTMTSTSVAGTQAQASATVPNPVVIGAIGTSANTAVANNQVTRLWADLNGRLATWNPPIGTHNNAFTGGAYAASAISTALDTVYCQTISVFGSGSVATTLTVQYSQDNTNYFDTATTISVPSGGHFGATYDMGARYIRLKTSAAATLAVTIAGKS